MPSVKTARRHERRPGPYPADRHCSCGAVLSRNNPGPLCAPCQGGDWHSPDELSTRRELNLARGRVEGLVA